MVKEAVEDGGGKNGVTEHFAPVNEALIRGQYHRPAFVASLYEPEQQRGIFPGQRQVADFIEDGSVPGGGVTNREV